MDIENQIISTKQWERMLFFCFFPIQLLLFPYLSTVFAGKNAILILLGGILFAFLYGFLCQFFLMQFQAFSSSDHNEEPVYFQSMQLALGTFFKKFFLFMYLSKNWILLLILGQFFTELIRRTILQDVSHWLILLLIYIVCLFIGMKNIEQIARFCEILYPFVVIPIIIFFFFGLWHIDFIRFLPTFPSQKESISSVFSFFHGSYAILVTYAMLDSIFFIGGSVKQKTASCYTPIFYSITKSGLLGIWASILTIGFLGVAQTNSHFFSSITMLRMLSLPGSFIKRQDSTCLAFWLISIYALLQSYFYQARILLCQLCSNMKNQANDQQTPIYYLLFFLFLASAFFCSLQITNIQTVLQNCFYFLSIFWVPFSLLLPCFILFFLKVTQKMEVH